MAKMVVIYNTPKNKEAFDKHYFQVHIPLAKKLPGLIKYEINKGSVVPIVSGGPEIYLIATLYFDSMETIKKSFASPEGQACAVDRKTYAPDELVKIYLFDTQDV